MAFVRCAIHYMQYQENDRCPFCALTAQVQAVEGAHAALLTRCASIDTRIDTIQATLKTVESHVLAAVNRLNDSFPTPARG